MPQPSRPVSALRRQGPALALMYGAQGLPAGLAFNAYATILRASGASLEHIGLAGLVFLPWALKFLWAGAIDNAGKRFGYGKLALYIHLFAVCVCVGMAFFAPGPYFLPSLIGILFLNTLFATQDIVTNAAAVSYLQGRNAGAANAIQVVAFLLGMLAGGGGGLLVYAHYGWAGVMLGMAATLFVLWVALLPLRQSVEPKRQACAAPSRWKDFLTQRGFFWALLSSLIFKFSGSALAILMQPFLIDHTVAVSTLGTLQMSNLFWNAVGGACIGAPLVKHFGSRRAVPILAAPSVLLLGTLWALGATGWLSTTTLYWGLGCESLWDGAFYVALWAMLMNWSSAKRPGMDYSFLQCGESAANVAAACLVTPVAAAMGYAHTFLGIWLVGVALLGVQLLAAQKLKGLCCDDTPYPTTHISPQ